MFVRRLQFPYHKWEIVHLLKSTDEWGPQLS